MGSYSYLHKQFKDKDKLDKAEGINTIYIKGTDGISSEIELGRTRIEIRNSLANIFEGIDEQSLDELTDAALMKKIEKDQLKDFAEKEKPELKTGLKAVSMDTSAIPQEKTQNPKDTSFVQKVETPTVPQNNDTKAKKEDLNNEGPEIE